MAPDHRLRESEVSQTIETQRCKLRPLIESDRDETFALYESKEVRRFLGGSVGRGDFDARFDNLLTSTSSRNWAIRLADGGAFVGTISIGKHHDGHDNELSYQLLPEFWGPGFAFEVATAILELASNTLKLSSIIAETQAANIASRKLLEKLGLTLDREVVRFGDNQVIYRTEFRRHNP